MRRKRQSIIHWLSGALLVLMLGTYAHAQVPRTSQYFYDDLGRLIKVVDSTGDVVEYIYDTAGNILEIKRSSIAPGSLALFNFTPRQGAVGTAVTIQGQGFSTTPSGNTVQFTSAVAPIISATGNSLVVTVPPAATTGPISVTVGGNTVITPSNFTVVPVPAITSISPKAAFSNSNVSIQVTGANLNDSTFSFRPTFSPPALSIAFATIDPSGNSATLSVIVNANAVGSFVLSATNTAGSSDTLPTAGNSLRVFDVSSADSDGDGLSNVDEVALGTDPFNADTDGDGFPDGLEVALGSDPLNAASRPNTNPPGETVGLTFSILNVVSPAPTQPSPMEADGLTFSLLNQLSPAPAQPIPAEADGLTFSLLNQLSPTPAQPTPVEADGLTFSLLNQLSPTPAQPTPVEADGLPFSLLSQPSPTPAQPTPVEVDGLAFSLLNQPSPPPAQPTLMEADGLTFSIQNEVPPVPAQQPLTESASLLAGQETGLGTGRPETASRKALRSRRRRSDARYTTKGRTHVHEKR